MQVTTEQIDPCQLALTITVPAERFAAARQKAANQASQSLQIPGFRKGKVPQHLAKNFLDPVKVQQRAAEIVVPEAYQQAVTESAVEPWADPQFEIVELPEGGELVFKATVPLRPKVTLGEYKGFTLDKRLLQVRDVDIDRELEQVRERFAEFPEMERAVETGDIILCELQATVEGAELPDLAEARTTAIEVGKNIPDFDAGLVGMNKGESKTITAVYPDEFEDESLRGKTGTFAVSVNEIRARVLPELNDELVQKAHRSAKSVEELRAEIRTSLEKAAVEMSDNELEFKPDLQDRRDERDSLPARAPERRDAAGSQPARAEPGAEQADVRAVPRRTGARPARPGRPSSPAARRFASRTPWFSPRSPARRRSK